MKHTIQSLNEAINPNSNKVVAPAKIKALTKKLYDQVKEVDKLTVPYDKANRAKAMKIQRKLEKQAESALKDKWISGARDLGFADDDLEKQWQVTSVEYSQGSGEWWAYLKDSTGETDQVMLIDLY